MPTWTHIEVHSHAEALHVMRALGDLRSCVVQEAANVWAIYVHADPEPVAEIATALGLSDYRAVKENELAAAGISHA